LEIEVLEIYGPYGISKYLTTTFKVSTPKLFSKIKIFEFIPPHNKNSNLTKGIYQNVETEFIYFDYESNEYHIQDFNSEDKIKIKAAPIKHTVFTVGYVFEEGSFKKFNNEKAIEYNLSNKERNQISNGIEVLRNDVAINSQVLTFKKGSKICIINS
jgi:ribonuclease BN (tRNA processing enzyme)